MTSGGRRAAIVSMSGSLFSSNVAFTARHIPGKANNVADALSRFQMGRFRESAPDAELSGTTVPGFLWDL